MSTPPDPDRPRPDKGKGKEIDIPSPISETPELSLTRRMLNQLAQTESELETLSIQSNADLVRRARANTDSDLLLSVHDPPPAEAPEDATQADIDRLADERRDRPYAHLQELNTTRGAAVRHAETGKLLERLSFKLQQQAVWETQAEERAKEALADQSDSSSDLSNGGPSTDGGPTVVIPAVAYESDESIDGEVQPPSRPTPSTAPLIILPMLEVVYDQPSVTGHEIASTTSQVAGPSTGHDGLASPGSDSQPVNVDPIPGISAMIREGSATLLRNDAQVAAARAASDRSGTSQVDSQVPPVTVNPATGDDHRALATGQDVETVSGQPLAVLRATADQQSPLPIPTTQITQPTTSFNPDRLDRLESNVAGPEGSSPPSHVRAATWSDGSDYIPQGHPEATRGQLGRTLDDSSVDSILPPHTGSSLDFLNQADERRRLWKLESARKGPHPNRVSSALRAQGVYLCSRLCLPASQSLMTESDQSGNLTHRASQQHIPEIGSEEQIPGPSNDFQAELGFYQIDESNGDTTGPSEGYEAGSSDHTGSSNTESSHIDSSTINLPGAVAPVHRRTPGYQRRRQRRRRAPYRPRRSASPSPVGSAARRRPDPARVPATSNLSSRSSTMEFTITFSYYSPGMFTTSSEDGNESHDQDHDQDHDQGQRTPTIFHMEEDAPPADNSSYTDLSSAELALVRISPLILNGQLWIRIHLAGKAPHDVRPKDWRRIRSLMHFDSNAGLWVRPDFDNSFCETPRPVPRPHQNAVAGPSNHRDALPLNNDPAPEPIPAARSHSTNTTVFEMRMPAFLWNPLNLPQATENVSQVIPYVDTRDGIRVNPRAVTPQEMFTSPAPQPVTNARPVTETHGDASRRPNGGAGPDQGPRNVGISLPRQPYTRPPRVPVNVNLPRERRSTSTSLTDARISDEETLVNPSPTPSRESDSSTGSGSTPNPPIETESVPAPASAQVNTDEPVDNQLALDRAMSDPGISRSSGFELATPFAATRTTARQTVSEGTSQRHPVANHIPAERCLLWQTELRRRYSCYSPYYHTWRFRHVVIMAVPYWDADDSHHMHLFVGLRANLPVSYAGGPRGNPVCFINHQSNQRPLLECIRRLCNLGDPLSSGPSSSFSPSTYPGVADGRFPDFWLGLLDGVAEQDDVFISYETALAPPPPPLPLVRELGIPASSRRLAEAMAEPDRASPRRMTISSHPSPLLPSRSPRSDGPEPVPGPDPFRLSIGSKVESLDVDSTRSVFARPGTHSGPSVDDEAAASKAALPAPPRPVRSNSRPGDAGPSSSAPRSQPISVPGNDQHPSEQVSRDLNAGHLSHESSQTVLLESSDSRQPVSSGSAEESLNTEEDDEASVRATGPPSSTRDALLRGTEDPQTGIERFEPHGPSEASQVGSPAEVDDDRIITHQRRAAPVIRAPSVPVPSPEVATARNRGRGETLVRSPPVLDPTLAAALDTPEEHLVITQPTTLVLRSPGTPDVPGPPAAGLLKRTFTSAINLITRRSSVYAINQATRVDDVVEPSVFGNTTDTPPFGPSTVGNTTGTSPSRPKLRIRTSLNGQSSLGRSNTMTASPLDRHGSAGRLDPSSSASGRPGRGRASSWISVTSRRSSHNAPVAGRRISGPITSTIDRDVPTDRPIPDNAWRRGELRGYDDSIFERGYDERMGAGSSSAAPLLPSTMPNEGGEGSSQPKGVAKKVSQAYLNLGKMVKNGAKSWTGMGDK